MAAKKGNSIFDWIIDNMDKIGAWGGIIIGVYTIYTIKFKD